MTTLTLGVPEIIVILPFKRNSLPTGWEPVHGVRCC